MTASHEPAVTIASATRKVRPELATLIRSLQKGDKIKVTQRVRCGKHLWTTTATGTFRDTDYLATGTSTQRVPEDDIVVPQVHFTKDNGEHASVTLDDYTQIERA